MSWLDALFRNAIALQGIPVATTVPTDGQALVYSASGATWQPGQGTTGPEGLVVSVVHSQSPYTPTANQVLRIDGSQAPTGAITINLPVLLLYQWVGVKIVSDPSVYNVTINAPATGSVEIPPGVGATSTYGTFGANFTMTSAGMKGESIYFRYIGGNIYEIR